MTLQFLKLPIRKFFYSASGKELTLGSITNFVMAHPYLDQIQELVNDIDLGNSEVVCKHFFSGAAVYANGKIVASLSPKGLAFKLTESRCAEVLSEGLANPLRYFEKSPIKRGYVLFPDKDQLRKEEVEGFFQECVLTSAQETA